MLPLDQVSFYGILDTAYVSKADWILKYDSLVAGAAGIIQIRAKNSSRSELLELTERIVAHRDSLREQPHLVINEHLDVCLSFPGLGLHLGQDIPSALSARKQLGPDRILGLSTQSKTQALAAIDSGSTVLNYFAVGPVFASKTKPTCPPVGLDLVRFVASKNPAIPFFCIGGINRTNIHQVRLAGANRIVAISDLLCDADTAEAVRQSIALIKA